MQLSFVATPSIWISMQEPKVCTTYIYDRYSQYYVCVYDVFVLLYLVLELQILDWESLYFAFVLWLIIACYPH